MRERHKIELLANEASYEILFCLYFLFCILSCSFFSFLFFVFLLGGWIQWFGSFRQWFREKLFIKLFWFSCKILIYGRSLLFDLIEQIVLKERSIFILSLILFQWLIVVLVRNLFFGGRGRGYLWDFLKVFYCCHYLIL